MEKVFFAICVFKKMSKIATLEIYIFETISCSFVFEKKPYDGGFFHFSSSLTLSSKELLQKRTKVNEEWRREGMNYGLQFIIIFR